MPKVREAILLIEKDGWQLKRINGSHRQYKHPNKPQVVTIAGKESKEIAKGTWNNILRQAGIKEIR